MLSQAESLSELRCYTPGPGKKEEKNIGLKSDKQTNRLNPEKEKKACTCHKKVYKYLFCASSCRCMPNYLAEKFALPST
jgi:hypothetical protein